MMIGIDNEVRRFKEGNHLEKAFTEKYGHAAEFIAVAPGRVNLIGEHIDYHGYSVLPMALSQSIRIAVSSNDSSQLHISNTSGDKYKDYSGSISDLDIKKGSAPSWHQYVLCGIKGVSENVKNSEDLLGMNFLVEGQVPPNAGLSSSSALVCCSALATTQANKLSFTPSELASICASSERHIGTEGGGMDQAISFLAEEGKAKLIDFDPLKSSNVVLPQQVVFVVAHSGVEMNKAATADFNTRVAEGRLGVQILAVINNLEWKSMKKAKELQKALKRSTKEMLALVAETFHEEPYSLSEISDLLEISAEDLHSQHLSASVQHLRSFELRKRLRHVFTEAARVEAFRDTCEGGGDLSGVQSLGDLMHDSHVSCRDDYECSCPELDELVDLMMKNGAYGARLTGAGWGGCAVAMVAKGSEDVFLRCLKKGFYEKDEEGRKRMDDALFVTAPGAGAHVVFPRDDLDNVELPPPNNFY
ncbi:hypothetical protein RvY_00854 [Ramazzottius varieornatus]|uniref:Galactokinase n=1 Tax=Ramazzottius varieornatus TaxID=947166 RepID=A0A1D1UPL0_RAMVA|nr:hypothetical protein RvY_00854 [Ramazzottius varieornatus]